MSYGGRGPPDTNGMISLKVDNLTYRTNPDDLKRHFDKFGEVGDIYIPRDRRTKESRGFAFVRYYDKRDAEDAMDEMDGAIVDGRELRVQIARYGRPSDPGRGRGGDSYRRRRRSYSRSRSRSPRRRRSRSRSRSRSRDRRDRSDSRSPYKSRSPSRSPRRSRSRSRS
ncbi:unnamed protein product [Owenia fusiformis]|uniref:Serine/arginine-rich splicing factor 2 n=1 Tax=Owenia fusiformis TaxID=6347 RepID=A0A8S4PI16_OWEFU|nr:unnamed protein product [Owenia fusiformis]